MVAKEIAICSKPLSAGRELLYPQPFGSVTAGADKDYPVDYSHLNIMGYALGAKGVEADPDKATFPNVNTRNRIWRYG